MPSLAATTHRLVVAALRAADPAACVRRAVCAHPRSSNADERSLPATLSVGGHALVPADYSRIVLLGAGKASASMAAALLRVLGDAGWLSPPSSLPLSGHVVTKYGHADAASAASLAAHGVVLSEAGHPQPDLNGVAAAAELLRLATSTDDARCLVILVLSGGGSALLPAPAEGVSLQELQALNAALLACGATIDEVNACRKHVSRIAGGRLAEACGASRVVTLALSDVVGDNLDVIASGPTVVDSATFSTALGVLRKYGVWNSVPGAITRYLEGGARGEERDTLKVARPRDLALVVGSNELAAHAVASLASDLGYRPVHLSSRVEGEAAGVAKVWAALLVDCAGGGVGGKFHLSSVLGSGGCGGVGASGPVCMIAGGETTVTLTSRGGELRGPPATPPPPTRVGKGGRNMELALAAAIYLDSDAARRLPIALLSFGTDGTDGPTDAAGALVTPHTCVAARAVGLDPALYLARHDAYTFFSLLGERLLAKEAAQRCASCSAVLFPLRGGGELGGEAAHVGDASARDNSSCVVQPGGLVVTGPTGTNVMDICVLLGGLVN